MVSVNSSRSSAILPKAKSFRLTLSGKARIVRYMAGTNAEVMEYTVAPGSAITKGPIKDLDFPQDAIIGGVIRSNEAMIAVGDTVIEPYDRVAIFSKPECIKEIDRFFK